MGIERDIKQIKKDIEAIKKSLESCKEKSAEEVLLNTEQTA